jgi:hypothetical protein
MSVARMPTGRGIAPLANVPNDECRDGKPELVIRGEHAVIPVPVLPRWRQKVASVNIKAGGRAQASIEVHTTDFPWSNRRRSSDPLRSPHRAKTCFQLDLHP